MPLLTVAGAIASAWEATLQVLNAIIKRFEPVLILADCIQVGALAEMHIVYAAFPHAPGNAHSQRICETLRHHTILCHAAGDCDLLLLNLCSAVL